jgi:hypothetical protein
MQPIRPLVLRPLSRCRQMLGELQNIRTSNKTSASIIQTPLKAEYKKLTSICYTTPPDITHCTNACTSHGATAVLGCGCRNRDLYRVTFTLTRLLSFETSTLRDRTTLPHHSTATTFFAQTFSSFLSTLASPSLLITSSLSFITL